MTELQSARVSHERLALAALERALEGLHGVGVFKGQGARNRFGVAGWEQTIGQQFQFGDLRVETSTVVVVEVAPPPVKRVGQPPGPPPEPNPDGSFTF